MSTTFGIRLRDDIEIPNPEERVREYCEIEVYRGYDDQHSPDNVITLKDIKAANSLYAMIDRYNSNESSRILTSSTIPLLLEKVRNEDLSKMSDVEWIEEKRNICLLLKELLSIQGIGLAKAFKILHLKRPKLLPILDSYVIKFLTGTDLTTMSEKSRLLEVGLNALEISRNILLKNHDAFSRLRQQLIDLPIPLTTVRLFDILCWTTAKWDIRGIITAPYGRAGKSLLQIDSLRENTSKARQELQMSALKERVEYVQGEYWVNVDKPTKTCTIHVRGCEYENRKGETEYKGIGNLKRDGGWLSFDSLKGAQDYCKERWMKQGFRVISHNCSKKYFVS